jgi:hypothetical protein
MTPADDRVLQLLQKWQKSLDLHARYADLPEDQYWLVQPWPNHQRPTKWVVDLARQRLADLQNIVKTRLAAGDPSLSEALELMSFLTNLVGSQHVERFVPIAEPERERQLDKERAPKATGATSTSTVLKPAPPPKPARAAGGKPKPAAKAPKPAFLGSRLARAARGDRAHRGAPERRAGAPDPAQQQGRDRAAPGSAGQALTH